MNVWSLVNTGSTLQIGNSLPTDVTSACAYTLTKAQQVGRDADADPTSPAYFTAMVASLQTLGWSTAGKYAYSYVPGTARITPAEIIIDALFSGLKAVIPIPSSYFQADYFIPILQKMANSAPASALQFMDHWWSSLPSEASVRTMRIAPTFSLFGHPMMLMTNLQLHFAADGWRDLLRECDPTVFQIDSQSGALSLDMKDYAKQEALLQQELDQQIRSEIQTMVLL